MSGFSDRFGKELSNYRQNLPTFIKSIIVDNDDDDEKKNDEKDNKKIEDPEDSEEEEEETKQKTTVTTSNKSTNSGSGFLTFNLQFCRPFDIIHVHFEEKYRAFYPNGTVTFSVTDRNGQSILRSLPASSRPTFERIASTIQMMAKTAGADSQAYINKTGIQSDNYYSSSTKNKKSHQEQEILNPLLQQQQNEDQQQETKNSTSAFSVGPSIEELFPLTNKNTNTKTENGDSDDYADNESSMMGRKSASKVMMAMTRSVSQHQTLHLQKNGTNNAPSSSSFAGGKWSVALTCEDDVALDALQSNQKLLTDIRTIEYIFDGGHHMGRNQISSSVFSTIQSLDAGLIRFSFSFSVVEMVEEIMRKYGSEHVYNINNSNNNNDDSSSSATMMKFLHNYHSSATVKSFFTLLQSLQMERSERFIFNFTVDPVQYPLGTCKLDFGQSSNFTRGLFPGAVGQLRRILENYIFSEQRIVGGEVSEEIGNAVRNRGFSEEEILIEMKNHQKEDEQGGNFAKAIEQLENEYKGSSVSSSSNTKNKNIKTDDKTPETISATQKLNFRKRHPPSELGIFVGCVLMFINRLPGLQDECCICARPHLFSLGSGSNSNNMCGISVCTRSTCHFRFSKLDVAKDIASNTALQTGVIDLLVFTARLSFPKYTSVWLS